MRRQGLFRLHHEQEGATAIIVALCLISLFGMLVLVVDVGGLLWKRREMVSGADAAALAAAKTCSVPAVTDPTDPETQADTAAVANVGGLNGGDGSIVDGIVTCRQPRGFVTVQYSYPQQLFFAGIFGASTRTVTTAATAAWGPLAGGNAVPIVLESSLFQSQCDVPDLDPGQECNFWYNNGDAAIGAGLWGFLNLDQWNVSLSTNCSSAGGGSSRGGYILNNFGSPLPLAEPGPTYVCSSPGHATDNWQDLNDRMNGTKCSSSYPGYPQCPGPIVLMPVNDCTKQVDKNGTIYPCGAGTPDKFAIIGFTTLELSGIYKGNDPLAIGTPGTPAALGDCGSNGADLALDGFGSRLLPIVADNDCGAPVYTSIDSIPYTSVSVTQKQGSKVTTYVKCPPVGGTNCDYRYNEDLVNTVGGLAPGTLQWINNVTWNDTNKMVHLSWGVDATPGTPGFCGERSPDPNAICLHTTWRGYTDQNGEVGTGPDFGTQGHVLCDFTYNSCPAGVKP